MMCYTFRLEYWREDCFEGRKQLIENDKRKLNNV